MPDIINRLREPVVSSAVERAALSDGDLAERLIRERHEAADEIERLRRERDALRDWISGLGRQCAEVVRAHSG